MKLYLIFILPIFLSSLFAQSIDINVFNDYEIKKVVFAYDKGSYAVFGDSTFIGTILPNEFIELNLETKGIQLNFGVEDKGVYSSVFVQQTTENQSIEITCKAPKLKSRKYQDNFLIVQHKNRLNIINQVEMENYLSGVVESEGGGGRAADYYKVQAIMCRTYALKNINRHASEGFSLCDRVHCQAYHHMLRYTPAIRIAVQDTKDMVLVDEHFDLGGTFFHANCGGQTSEASKVWNNDLPYLKPFKDTFCIYTKQAEWEVKIPQQKWADFLVNKYNYPLYDSLYGPMMFTFNQPERLAFYISPVLGIPLRDLRSEFKLKSTFFSCFPEGINVVVRGKGVGHGIGLCQEGAMKMAQYGYSYQQIALYYFPGLRLVNYRDYLFFNQRKTNYQQF